MTVRRLVLGLLVGAVGACTSSASGTVDGPVSYRSTGGFTGGGDGTPAIRVDPDGTATRTRAGAGAETAMLDPSTLDGLYDKVREAQFPALAPMYRCQCADDFLHEVTVQLDGKIYDVQADYGAPPPQQLTIVINALREISQLPLDWH